MASITLIKAGVVSAFTISLIGLGAAGIFTTVHGDPVNEEATYSLPAAGAVLRIRTDQTRFEIRFGWCVLPVTERAVGVDVADAEIEPIEDEPEDATDPTKIISFKGKNSKEISETCLACHAGKETHNNFRRGEHWRNDVGCTDCHIPHGSPLCNSIFF